MKTKYVLFFVFIAIALIGCISTKSGGPYFTGSGKKEMHLGIIVPASNGLTNDKAYLPSTIQGHLVSNIKKYSAISVLDRVALDKVIAETLDPTYEDNLDIVRLGHVAQVAYMLTGTITQTSTGYTLQLNISDTTQNANTVASYSGNWTSSQIDDFSAINRASQDLLIQLGVELTSSAKNELGKASTPQEVKGQTTLSKGIVAQRNGTVVEAMSYYNEATRLDPTLREASDRLSTLSSSVRTGNIGVDARNRIAERNAWISTINQCGEYYSNHLPVEIKYSPKLKQTNINYQNGTVDLQFNISVYESNNINIMKDIYSGLQKTKKVNEWGLEGWPISNSFHYGSYIDDTTKFFLGINGIVKQSKNDFSWTNTETIHTTNNKLSNGLIVIGPGPFNYLKDHFLQTSLHFELINEKGKTISHSKFIVTNKVINIKIYQANDVAVFSNVLANDITDNLAIKLLSVNGREAIEATQNGYLIIISK